MTWWWWDVRGKRRGWRKKNISLSKKNVLERRRNINDNQRKCASHHQKHSTHIKNDDQKSHSKIIWFNILGSKIEWCVSQLIECEFYFTRGSNTNHRKKNESWKVNRKVAVTTILRSGDNHLKILTLVFSFSFFLSLSVCIFHYWQSTSKHEKTDWKMKVTYINIGVHLVRWNRCFFGSHRVDGRIWGVV